MELPLCQISAKFRGTQALFPGGSDGKVFAYNAGDLGSIPGSGRSPGEGNVNPLQYSRLENHIDRGAWQATVHGVAKSQTRLSDFTHSLTHSGPLILLINWLPIWRFPLTPQIQ